MSSPKKGIVRYQDVDAEYLQKRQLKKSAGWILLWAMGVGAVISGNFFGWNTGLKVGGFWGLTIATLVMAVMYICMVFSIAELSAALPHAGGFYSFVRNALGPTAGYLCGITDTIEYVLTPAVIVVGISGYMNTLIFGSLQAAPEWTHYAWWLFAYGLFVGINLRGVELTLKIGLLITALAVAVLFVFFGAVYLHDKFDWQLLFNVEPAAGHQADGLPFGWRGVFSALPFAIWFFLAIEQLPLAAEETHNPVRDMPRALIWSMATLLVLSLLTLVFNSGVGGGAAEMGQSGAPLADGIRAVFGDRPLARVLMLVAVAGLVASFHSVIYAYGRVLFSLSRAGYFPRWISIVNRQQTPQNALLLGAVIGLACAALLHQFEGQAVAAALLNMAVFGAVISYMLVLFSFVWLRIHRPTLARPYRSPLGVPGAMIGLVLAALSLIACFSVPDYRPSVAGTALFVALGMAYYFLYSRQRLVAQAPEEEVALIQHAEEELA